MGLEVEIVTDCTGLERKLNTGSSALIIVNLDSLKNDIVRLGEIVRGKSIACVGYYSHVNTQLAEEAKRAGIGTIMPRGVFVKKIGEIMAQVLRG